MNEALALELTENYLKGHKYSPVRIDATKLPTNKKAPDFEVKDTIELRFYCEVKTPELKPNDKTQMFHWTTTISKLRDLIHKAVKQFRDQDPQHSKPWVLVINSDHFQLNWSNFAHCIQGIIAYNSQIIKDLRNQRFIEETDEDIRAIDLFIWCQVNDKEKKIYQMVHFLNQGSALLQETKTISDNLIPYMHENIIDRNSKQYTRI